MKMIHIPIGTCVPGNRFEQWVKALNPLGFECYAMNFHMSVGELTIDDIREIAKRALGGTGAYLSSVGFYCNALQYPEHKQMLETLIDNAESFGTRMVTTFAGALEGKSVEDAMPAFGKVFGELARRAEDKGVKIAIENCPMGGTWRSNTCNIGFGARSWELMFNEVDSHALGLEWEPAHQICQLVEPIANLRAFAKKVLHIHGKDAVVNNDIIAKYGLVSGFEPVTSRFPGFGDTDWRKIFAILAQTEYAGDMVIEGYHDPLYHGDWEATGQAHALKYLRWCRGGEFADCPLY